MRNIFLFTLLLTGFAHASEQKIVLAGGCFWCMEKPFEQIPGVLSVTSGYAQGNIDKPTYKQVSSGTTGHIEVVEVKFDDSIVPLTTILSVFWQQINPTDNKGQFVDRGFQYTTGIFFSTKEQEAEAENSKKLLIESKIFKQEIVTPIQALKTFFLAEEYHQDYYKKNSIRYWYYRNRSGRDEYLNSIWTKENKELWAKSYPTKHPKP